VFNEVIPGDVLACTLTCSGIVTFLKLYLTSIQTHKDTLIVVFWVLPQSSE